VDVDEARDFVRQHGRAVMHTYRQDGSPQLSPVLVVADDDGRLLVSTREPSMKAKNLARDPRVSLCVFNEAFFGAWIRVDGRAELVHLPDAMDLLVDYYRRGAGEHDDWDAYREAMAEEQRLIVRITVERAGPDQAG
jgi:PPOX class probable F420-dependent enzyme